MPLSMGLFTWRTAHLAHNGRINLQSISPCIRIRISTPGGPVRNPDKRVNFSACVIYAALLVSCMESTRTHYSNNAIILVEETEVWHNSSNGSGGINPRGLLTPGVND